MKFIQTFIIIFSLFLSSCSTADLWNNGPHKFNTSYDIVKEFMISKDGHKIIILGTKYHYIFDDESGEIKKILTWEGRSKLEMFVNNFELLPSNKIKGSVMIRVMNNKKLSENELEFLKNVDLVSWKEGQNLFKEKNFNLVGTRYLPEPGVTYKTSSSLNKEYKIKITNNGFSSKLEKIALTPVTVAADGIVLVFGAVAYGITVIAIEAWRL